ncbi:MAG: NAD(+) synthase [Erysipelotrichaceae bacterium]|nr:NAD(+) synthase [Erysipelotrichaceae bacterium]
MKKKTIKPITELRNTSEISKQCHESDNPIFITKNGYEDLVVMSSLSYNKLINNKDDVNENNHSTYNIIKVGCACNEIKLACPSKNKEEIILKIKENSSLDILVFPELSVTGYFCSDLFYQDSLINNTNDAIKDIVKATIGINTLIFIGAPISFLDKLYNCALALHNGKVLGVIPKKNLPNYNEFYEGRQFNEYHGENTIIYINDKPCPFGTKLIFSNRFYSNLNVACEICEDLWSPDTPSTSHALAGANIIVNLSASNELFHKDKIREMLVLSTSYRLHCAYLYASVGNGESTQDVVYSSHNIIAENGELLVSSPLFSNQTIISEIDLEKLSASRRKNTSFRCKNQSQYQIIYFDNNNDCLSLTRKINPFPFLPNNENESIEYAKHIINLQVMALSQRLKHIHCKDVVIGLSGGLDSTLALIVCYETFKYLKLNVKNIHCISMPCFGTSSRTKDNAKTLAKILKCTYKVINIKESVMLHLKDINHDNKNTNITYENAQARERTQILFDYANEVNGIVIGTGDLSELALGWCTYNGDHMSNYAVNVSIPKTLVIFLVKAYANSHSDLKEVLYDILDTPISPELLPLLNDKIVQKTQDIIGPYELHDFFLYHFLKYNFSAKKILFYAKEAFKDIYDEQTIKKWLDVFIKRFFNNQFKRSCIPDGPKVTEISLSPRGDLRMPSDAFFDDFKLDID